MLKSCVITMLELVEDDEDKTIYPKQKRLLLKLLSIIMLILDNNWKGTISLEEK